MRLCDLQEGVEVVVRPNKGKANLAGKCGRILSWERRRAGALVKVNLDVGVRTLPASLLERSDKAK